MVHCRALNLHVWYNNNSYASSRVHKCQRQLHFNSSKHTNTIQPARSSIINS
jgi:hypothetical protein